MPVGVVRPVSCRARLAAAGFPPVVVLFRSRLPRLLVTLAWPRTQMSTLQVGPGNDTPARDAPDFLIVGAAKAGTTSLGVQLGRHPRICIPRAELHYFDRPDNFARGPDWYLDALTRSWEPGNRVLGEKTPTYCYLAQIAERIYRDYPGVKLIWLLRNPVDRAYSNYLHAVRRGNERLSFARAVTEESRRIRRDPFTGYLERSRYWQQIERFDKWFPREQMQFHLFEDFASRLEKVLDQVFDFLGVASEEFSFVDVRHNRTRMPRWPGSVWAARQLLGDGTALKAVRKLNSVRARRGYPKLDAGLRRELVQYFRDDNARLAEMLGCDLSRWNT